MKSTFSKILIECEAVVLLKRSALSFLAKKTITKLLEMTPLFEI